jgi:hypothetical protein
MAKKEDVVLEAVTEYAKNPDTYKMNFLQHYQGRNLQSLF